MRMTCAVSHRHTDPDRFGLSLSRAAFPPEVHDEGHDKPLTVEARPSVWLNPGEEAAVHPLVSDLWPALEPGCG